MKTDGWGQKHQDSQSTLFKFIVSLIGDIPCDEVTPDDLTLVLSEAAEVSFSKVEHVASALSAFIRWGVNKGWITQNHNALLGALAEATTVKEKRRTKKSGESKLHVDSRDIPTHEDVSAYGREAARIGKMWWFELMVNLAAYSGLRLGEEMDLSIDEFNNPPRACGSIVLLSFKPYSSPLKTDPTCCLGTCTSGIVPNTRSVCGNGPPCTLDVR